MDTDGSCCENRTSYSTKSAQLAQDVVELVQSLGGTAISKHYAPRDEWNVNVKTFHNPFKLPRKANRWSFSEKNPPSRYIVDITPTRVCDHVCIKVAAKDGLFLTKDYIVTHNSTCLKVLSDRIGPPVFLAPTGKAALRMTELTGIQASTIHRWMYKATEDKYTGEVHFAPKPIEEIQKPENHLIVVDEASMVSEPLWEELRLTAAKLHCNLLLVGDPFQLPPVDPEAKVPFCILDDSFKTELRADLTEIFRQALDNPIIAASMAIREGNVDKARSLLPQPSQAEALKLSIDLNVAGDGVVICHRNVTRHATNSYVRSALKRSKKGIDPGEPLLILKNNYDAGVFNGEVTPFTGWEQESNEIEVYDSYRKTTIETAFGVTRFNGVKTVMAHERIYGRADTVGYGALAFVGCKLFNVGMRGRKHQPSHFGKTYQLKIPFLDANFGFCLTAHRSQGSEWDRVLVVIEPSIRLSQEEGLRWIYTATTRARKQAFLYWK
jgi:exodeoxyribonuclease-5